MGVQVEAPPRRRSMGASSSYTRGLGAVLTLLFELGCPHATAKVSAPDRITLLFLGPSNILLIKCIRHATFIFSLCPSSLDVVRDSKLHGPLAPTPVVDITNPHLPSQRHVFPQKTKPL